MSKNKVIEKTEHSMFSNIFYFLKLLFSISPSLVVGECIWGVVDRLPTRLISVIGVKYVIDIIASGKDTKRVFYAVIAIALLLIFSELFVCLFREFFWNAEKERVKQGLSEKLYKKAKELDLQSYDDPHFYNSFILTIEASGDNIANILGMVRRYFGELVSLITICAVLLTIDPICLLIILIIVVIFTPISKKIGEIQAERQIVNNRYHRRADYFARIFYLGDYAKEVRMNNIKPLLIKRYNSAADDVIKNQKKYVGKIDTIFFFQESGVQLFGFMFFLPLYLGYSVLKTKTLSAGDFVATFNGAYSIAASFSFITVGAVRNFSERARLVDKYRAFLRATGNIKDGKDIAKKEDPKIIELKNVSFTYPGNEKPTLNNINLTLRPNEKIALVGYNGAGKTTLTNLLLRLYDVTDGKILIDGKDIRGVSVQSHRDRFAAVFQDFQVFATSLGENVALDVDFDEEKIKEALLHSGFNKNMPNGIKTELLREFDDNGVMMSGGEMQKIAISRAFYKDCPYVILDEPSANLDPVAEYKLNQAMMEAAKNKTVIFISHRLSTTVGADKIYVMENGSVIESGSHDELMALSGTYAKMFNLQAEKYQIDN